MKTPVPVQMRDGRGENHQAYLWQYGEQGGETVFDFCLGLGREGPRKFLDKWEGILQTDGYAAYDNIGGPKLVHVGCWAHARRKFVDAVKVNQKMRRRWRWSRVAQKRARAGGCLHFRYVGQAAALFRLPASGVVQQSGRELDAAGSARAQERAARGQHAGRTQSGRDSLGCRILRRFGVPVKNYLAAVLPGLNRRTFLKLPISLPFVGQPIASDHLISSGGYCGSCWQALGQRGGITTSSMQPFRIISKAISLAKLVSGHFVHFESYSTSMPTVSGH